MNMVSDDRAGVRPIVVNGEVIEKTPDPTILDWVKYYAYNFTRKPKVWRAQRDLIEIYRQIQKALERDVYPQLIKNRTEKGCGECADAYAALKPQIFLSQIERVLKQMKCSTHHRIFESFYLIHESKFKQSEDLAAWINGFKK